MRVIQCDYYNHPKGNDICLTDSGYLVFIKQYVRSTDHITSDYEYEYISPYPYNVRSTYINSRDIKVIFRDALVADIRREYPEYFI